MGAVQDEIVQEYIERLPIQMLLITEQIRNPFNNPGLGCARRTIYLVVI